MTVVLGIVALLGFLIAGSRILRRLPPRWAMAFWIAVPLLLLPLWLRNSAEYHWPWFLWAKTWSVVLACAWIALCAARAHVNASVVALSLQLVLGVNILEAVAKDASEGRTVNAMAGALLVVALAGAGAPRVDALHGRREVAFDLGWTWIASYTLWNVCFVYGSFAFVAGQHVGVLGAAVVLALRDGQASWFVARATTLGLHLLVYDSFFGFFYRFDTRSWAHPTVLTALAWASLASALAALAVAMARRAQRVGTRGGDGRRSSHVDSSRVATGP